MGTATPSPVSPALAMAAAEDNKKSRVGRSIPPQRSIKDKRIPRPLRWVALDEKYGLPTFLGLQAFSLDARLYSSSADIRQELLSE